MLVNESLSRVAEEKLRDDQEPDIFFTVQGLLKDMATVTIGRQLYDTSSSKRH
jgi:hypothetical protein